MTQEPTITYTIRVPLDVDRKIRKFAKAEKIRPTTALTERVVRAVREER